MTVNELHARLTSMINSGMGEWRCVTIDSSDHFIDIAEVQGDLDSDVVLIVDREFPDD